MLIVPEKKLYLPRRRFITGAAAVAAATTLYPDLAQAAILVDATGTTLNSASAATVNYTGITVGPGLTNGALIVFVSWGGPVTSPSVTWDSGGTNQAMTQIATGIVGSISCAMFGLVNPTAGNKTCAISWTTSRTSSVTAQSYTGVLQTGGTTTWPNSAQNSGSSVTTLSLSVTSASGNRPTALFKGSTALTITAGTQIYDNSTTVSNAAAFLAGAASVTFTVTNASGNDIACGCDMVAAAGANATKANSLQLLGVGG